MTLYRITLQEVKVNHTHWKRCLGGCGCTNPFVQERLQVFSTASREGLDEQLAWENQ